MMEAVKFMYFDPYVFYVMGRNHLLVSKCAPSMKDK